MPALPPELRTRHESNRPRHQNERHGPKHRMLKLRHVLGPATGTMPVSLSHTRMGLRRLRSRARAGLGGAARFMRRKELSQAIEGLRSDHADRRRSVKWMTNSQRCQR
jgi:hypothetical protein